MSTETQTMRDEQDHKDFHAFIHEMTNGKPHELNRLDLHVLTWSAALAAERARSKCLIEALDWYAKKHGDFADVAVNALKKHGNKP